MEQDGENLANVTNEIINTANSLENNMLVDDSEEDLITTESEVTSSSTDEENNWQKLMELFKK